MNLKNVSQRITTLAESHSGNKISTNKARSFFRYMVRDAIWAVVGWVFCAHYVISQSGQYPSGRLVHWLLEWYELLGGAVVLSAVVSFFRLKYRRAGENGR